MKSFAWRLALTGIACTALAAAAASADVSYAFKIGTYPAYALKDGGMSAPNDGKLIGVGHTPDEVAAVLQAAGAPTDHFELSIQPLLVRADGRVLLFDTGAGTFMGEAGGKLPGALAAIKVAPSKVTDIFISHAHGDHIGGLITPDGKLAFVNATIHLSKPEWAFLKGLTAEQAEQFGIKNHAALIAAISPKVAAFEPDAELVPGAVTAVSIKGHTPGHSGYRVGSGSASVLYIGDAMHHFVISVQRPDWRIMFDTDPAVAQASRKMLDTKDADSGERLYAVHFPFPGIGRIVKSGDGFQWQPEARN